MIFGFNTDVKHGDQLYHVQSEARQNDLLLQTQVFQQGRCIGKRATSFAAHFNEPDFSENKTHELLKEQHRMVVEAVRAGRVQEVVSLEVEIQDVDGSGLVVNWLNSQEVCSTAKFVMRVQVTDLGQAVEGALVTTRLGSTPDGSICGQNFTETDGTAEMEIQISDSGGHEIPVLVRAKYGDKTAARKFRIRKAE